jgi:biopolymer transport protein ExbD
MNWKVRHEGSPQAVELTFEQLQDGLADGRWEATDEVQGPDDAGWVPIESHPALAELAAELEPPPPKTYDDETRLDMTALIDVCLVLLVFFILTTTVAALQKRLEAPSAEQGAVAKIPIVTEKEVAEQMIHVTAKMENDEPVIRVEGKVVAPDNLVGELRRYVRGKEKKTKLLLEHDDHVSQETVVQIIDAAKGAGVERIAAALSPLSPCGRGAGAPSPSLVVASSLACLCFLKGDQPCLAGSPIGKVGSLPYEGEGGEG